MARESDVPIGVPDPVAIAKGRRLAASGAGRALRVAAGLSLRDLARALGTSPAVVSRWERGQRVPHADMAEQWVTLLGRLQKEDA